jgi:hypothetical protein
MKPNHVIQLNPRTTQNRMFAGCLMVVTEKRDWGLMGYVQALGENGEPGGQAYYRARWEEIEPLTDGMVPWVIGQRGDDDE